MQDKKTDRSARAHTQDLIAEEKCARDRRCRVFEENSSLDLGGRAEEPLKERPRLGTSTIIKEVCHVTDESHTHTPSPPPSDAP